MKHLSDLYLEISNRYNESELCIEHGWRHKPSSFELQVLSEVSKQIKDNSVVLDVGTGMGIAPRLFKELGAKVITIDSYEASGGLAIDNIKGLGIEYYFVDILKQKLPLKNTSVDVIFFGDVIEHLHHSPKYALNEFKRVLKGDGSVFISTPNATRLTARIKMLIGISNWSNIYEYFDQEGHYGHIHEYTEKELNFVMEKSGFYIEKTHFIESRLSPKVSMKSIISGLYFLMICGVSFVKIFKSLRSHILVTAKK